MAIYLTITNPASLESRGGVRDEDEEPNKRRFVFDCDSLNSIRSHSYRIQKFDVYFKAYDGSGYKRYKYNFGEPIFIDIKEYITIGNVNPSDNSVIFDRKPLDSFLRKRFFPVRR